MTAALTIAFVPGVSPAKWARVWRERFPSIELVLRPIGSDDVSSALAGDVDMAFVRLPVADDLEAIPLWTETAVVAMPKDSPLADLDAVDLTEHDVHVVDPGPVPADVDGALDLVEANVGVVVLPQSLFRKASRKPLVARELVGSPGTRVALVWRAEDASDVTAEFIGVVRGRTANSSRSAADQPGGAERVGTDGSRPAGGAGSAGSGSGSAGGSGSGGGKAKAGTSSSAAKRGATKGTGGKGGGGKNSSGRGRTQRGMKGKPRRGSKGNR